MIGNVFLMLLPFVPASMFVLFLVLVVQVLYRSLFVPPGMEKDHDGICAACGYALGGLDDQRCPECGVDLLRAGVLTRRMYIQLRGSGLGAITAWTILVFSVGGVGLAVWGSFIQTNYWMNNTFGGAGGAGSYTQSVSYGTEVTWNDETREMEGDLFTVRFDIPVDAMTQALVGDVTLVLELPNDDEVTMVIEADGSWVTKDAKGKEIGSSDELKADAIDQLFIAGGFDVTSDQFRSYANQIYVMAEATRSDGMEGHQSVGMTRMSTIQSEDSYSYQLVNNGWTTGGMTMTGLTPPGGIPYAMWSPVLYGVIGLVLVYLLGMIFIVRRRRKMLSIGRFSGVQMDS